MKVVHIESGLGNQMLSYCEYLALRYVHPSEECYIETLIYSIEAANEYICQWNGYELEKIFGIKAPNIRRVFSDEQWTEIIDVVTQSEFWKKNWNYPRYIVEAFARHGLKLDNIRGDFETNPPEFSIASKEKPPVSFRIKQTSIYSNIRRLLLAWLHACNAIQSSKSDVANLFYTGNNSVFTGQRLSFKFLGNQIEKIDKEIRKAFTFPQLRDDINLNILQEIQRCESVSIHARRGDMLTVNGVYYKNGYFQRAVKYLKKHVKNPVFFFFCDPGSIEWCRENQRVFGLNFKKDKIFFVDWNKGYESYRDMQLMSHCKHNIITNSSFGWWGAYLNTNLNKITISPEIEINTMLHC